MLNCGQMTVIRVFPKRDSYTPIDDLAFVGDPQLFLPAAKEVHVSVTFTWDLEEGHRLKEAWGKYYPVVKIGGPAVKDNLVNGFKPGMYIKQGVTFTSRGCDRNCPWCLVPEREGEIRLLDIQPGWIIQDNNLLMTNHRHQEKVYRMLKCQQQEALFTGGIDARLVDDWVAEQFRDIRIKRIYLAADTAGSLSVLARAVGKLSFLHRERMTCYVLIGFEEETLEGVEEKLRDVWEIGCMPFAMLYQPPDKYLEYESDWKELARKWTRPQIIRARMRNGQLSQNS